MAGSTSRPDVRSIVQWVLLGSFLVVPLLLGLVYWHAVTDFQDLILGVRAVGHLLGIIMAMLITFIGFRTYLTNALGPREADPPSTLLVKWKDLQLSNVPTGTVLLLTGALFFWIVLAQSQVEVRTKQTTTPDGTQVTEKTSRVAGAPAVTAFLDTLKGLGGEADYSTWQSKVKDEYNKAKQQIAEAIKSADPKNQQQKLLLEDIQELANQGWSVQKWLRNAPNNNLPIILNKLLDGDLPCDAACNVA